ncbi:MAG: hypothetical protein ACLRWF_09425 [Ruthenibacterium sp.]
MSKRIAVIGSSGGNLYNQGGSDPNAMMKEIFTQAQSAGIEVSFIQFIGAQATMDNISMDAKARLYTLEGGQLTTGPQASLKEINQQAEQLDEQLAGLIDEGSIDGLVLMSSDPKGVNAKAVAAAAQADPGRGHGRRPSPTRRPPACASFRPGHQAQTARVRCVHLGPFERMGS